MLPERTTKLARAIGLTLVVSAVIAMLFSLFGLIEIWRIRATVNDRVSYNLNLLYATLTTTNQTLTLLNDTVDTIGGNVNSLEITTGGMVTTVLQTRPMLDATSRLLGTDIPATITATQTSLHSAQTSAQLIDNMLSTLSKIPLLGLGQYKPAVPLNESLGNVSNNLENLKPSLKTIQQNLGTVNENLGNLAGQIGQICEALKKMDQNLSEARTLIGQYQATNNDLLSQVQRLQERSPGWILDLAWLLTVIVIPLIITQIGLFIQGLELLGILHPGTLRRVRH
jgi:methyl-accepting chemotaxis protein